jgi:hypothetical protein
LLSYFARKSSEQVAMTASDTAGTSLAEADGEFIQDVEDDLDLDYSGVVVSYAEALRAGMLSSASLHAPAPVTANGLRSLSNHSFVYIVANVCAENSAACASAERIGLGKPPKQTEQSRPQTARPASAATCRSRPASRRAASAQQHLARKKCIETMSPLLWDSAAVGVWLTSIGMGQYKKHFTHNAVNGRLILALDAHTLKAELKISPFGHRTTICDAIEQLRASLPEGTDRSLSPEARSGLIKGDTPEVGAQRIMQVAALQQCGQL